MLQRLGLNGVWLGVIISSILYLGAVAGQSAPGFVSANTVVSQQQDQEKSAQDEQEKEKNRLAEIEAAEQEAAEKAKTLKLRKKAESRTVWTDPALVAGHQKCVDCHQTEIKAWLASKHSSRAFDLLRTSESALEYAKKLDIRPADIAKSSLCVNCHGTPQIQLDQSVGVIPGVSCEACHNGSDGDNGWLNIHAVYGFADTVREQETGEHFAFRDQRCQESGQLRSSNLYGLTKRCYDCHVNGDEALAIAGHDHGDGFEMVAKSLGEIRHNFLLNENENAKIATLWTDPFRHGQQRTVDGRLRVMFILGQMIDLEISFRNLARATEENDFSDAMSGRIEDAFELLAEDILEEVADAEEGEEGDEKPDLGDIEAVVKIVEPVWEQLDDDGFDVEQANQYIATAEAIATVAQKFAQRDGSKLAFLDDLDLLPEDVFEGAYDPNPKASKPSDDQPTDDQPTDDQ